MQATRPDKNGTDSWGELRTYSSNKLNVKCSVEYQMYGCDSTSVDNFVKDFTE